MADPNPKKAEGFVHHLYHHPVKVMTPFGYWAAVAGIVIGVLGVGLAVAFVPSVHKFVWPDPAPAPVQAKKYRVLVPLDATSAEYAEFRKKESDPSGNGTFDRSYSNRSSQNIREVVKVAIKQWFSDGVAMQRPRVFQDDKDVDFFFFPEGYSHADREGTPEQENSYKVAFDQAFAEAGKANREVVAVVGNVSSTATLKYAAFCKDKNLPMILPMATATDLTHNLEISGVPAVLRLPPTNDKQAKAISDFLLGRNIRKTVVVRDISNPAYSGDLVEKFREHYVEEPLSSAEKRKSLQFGQILAEIPVGGKETAPYPFSALSNESTALLIVGMTNSSIETLAQVKLLHSKYSCIILTDGSVDEYLADQISGIQATTGAFSNLYLSFPSPCIMPKSLMGYLEKDKTLNERDFELSHALYVADAAYITLSMLANGLSNDPSKAGNVAVTDAIRALRAKAIQLEEQKHAARPDVPLLEVIGQPLECPLPFVSNNDKREYEVDRFGNNISANYFFYTMIRGSDPRQVTWAPLTQTVGDCYQPSNTPTVSKRTRSSKNSAKSE